MASAVAFALVATSAISASAAPDQGDQVASLISRVAPHQGNVVRGATVGATTKAAAGSTHVSIPSDPTLPVQISGPTGTPLKVTLPASLELKTGHAATDGTVVYGAGGQGVNAAVQALADGSVRMQTIINSATAPRDFTYQIGAGFKPFAAADGSIWVAGFGAAGDYQVYSIGAAWARDANGHAVATRYEIRGNSVVQIVEPTADTVFPVVADPQWIWYNFAYGAAFSKSETHHLANFGAITGFCAALPGQFAIACAIFGADWFLQAALASEVNGCVFIAVVPAPIALRWISSSCR
jgi:hypothetical protein